MPIVITGLRGFLGSVLLKSKPVGVEIVGTTRATAVPTDFRGITWESIALDNRDQVSKLFARHTPDVVIHAAGEANVDRAQADPISAVQSNVVTTTHLAQACSQHNCHLVYISSNAVFSGVEAPYAEDAPTRPVNNYGLLKVASEQVALALNPTTTIVRPILMYGWPTIGGRTNPVHFMIKKTPRRRTHTDGRRRLRKPTLRRPVRRSNLEHRQRPAAYCFPPRRRNACQPIRTRQPNTTFVTNRMMDVLGSAPLSLADGLAAMRSNEA